MPGKIIFYHNPWSRAGMVHTMLEELGIAYETRFIDFEKDDQKSPEFLAINPMGKIPAIVVDGTPITETPAIIAWLADAYPDAGLAPPVGTPERGTYYRWLFFGGSCFEPALADVTFHRPPVEQKRALGWGSYDDVIDTIEAGLDPGPWLLGDKFTAADVYMGAELSWASMFDAPRLKESARISAYVERFNARPAMQKVMESAR